MRSVLLLGVAAVVVLWANPVHADDSPRVVVVQRGVDYGLAPPVDARVYTGRDDRQITEADYRERWTGGWEGQWAADGTSYNGTFRGTYRPDTAYGYGDADPYRYGYADERVAGDDVYYAQVDDYRGAPRYAQSSYDAREMERLCGDDATVGGAVAGAAIGSAVDRQRCEAWRAGYPRTRRVMARGSAYPGYGYAYPAYYYPTAPAVVTTVIIEGGGTVVVR